MQPYKDPRAALQLAGWMRSAGFVEIESRLLTLPMCGWSSGMTGDAYADTPMGMSSDRKCHTEARDYEIGLANKENVSQLLYSQGLYPITHFKG
jgi:hypothetical protein